MKHEDTPHNSFEVLDHNRISRVWVRETQLGPACRISLDHGKKIYLLPCLQVMLILK